jgi:broad specificity phosphatase PhoE
MRPEKVDFPFFKGLLAMDTAMQTIMYLIRHGATEANLAKPTRLQGQRHNPVLARLGIRQAELTRDFLAVRPIDHCYCSPLLRAVQTATIIAAPHGLSPLPLEELTECDMGNWEGMDWQEIRYLDADGYQKFANDPGGFAYPGGESLAAVYSRATTCLHQLLTRHAGQSILVVAHHLINRTYLAGLLGLDSGPAQQMTLDNCGISVVTRSEDGKTNVGTLNAAFHLQGLAA